MVLKPVHLFWLQKEMSFIVKKLVNIVFF